MFYIESIRAHDGKYGVVDTNDNVREFYTEEELRSFDVNILGLYDKCILVVAPFKHIKYWWKQGYISDMVNKMPLYHDINFRFTRVLKGELTFKEQFEVCITRTDKDKYTYKEEIGSGRYKFLDGNDVISRLDYCFKHWRPISIDCKENFIEFKYIDGCKDKQYLYDMLNKSNLSLIESVLRAYHSNRIDITEPRYANGDINLNGDFSLIINDSTYVEKGIEVLVLKWYNSYENTGYLVDYFT